jgi:hypothetical protein
MNAQFCTTLLHHTTKGCSYACILLRAVYSPIASLPDVAAEEAIVHLEDLPIQRKVGPQAVTNVNFFFPELVPVREAGPSRFFAGHKPIMMIIMINLAIITSGSTCDLHNTEGYEIRSMSSILQDITSETPDE